MKYSEVICKGSAYEMYLDEKGNEKHVESMYLNGKEATGEPYIRASTGKFPNLTYNVTFHEAYTYLTTWWGRSLSDRLRHGENCTLAYIKDNRLKHAKLKSGESMYEIAYDINYKKGKHYTKDGVRRYKIVICKV